MPFAISKKTRKISNDISCFLTPIHKIWICSLIHSIFGLLQVAIMTDNSKLLSHSQFQWHLHSLFWITYYCTMGKGLFLMVTCMLCGWGIQLWKKKKKKWPIHRRPIRPGPFQKNPPESSEENKKAEKKLILILIFYLFLSWIQKKIFLDNREKNN